MLTSLALIGKFKNLNSFRKRYSLCHVTARPVITLPLLWYASCRRLQDALAGRTQGPPSVPADLTAPARIRVHMPFRCIIYSLRAALTDTSRYAVSPETRLLPISVRR